MFVTAVGLLLGEAREREERESVEDQEDKEDKKDKENAERIAGPSCVAYVV